MKIKFISLLVIILVVGSPVASAQKKSKKQRPVSAQIMQKQTEQMVQVLMLDPALAAQFAPVYTNYLKELYACRTAKGRKHTSSLTGEELEKLMKEHFAQSRRTLDVREKYYHEFRKILSPKQIAKVYKIEKNNAAKLKKELDGRKGEKKRRRTG